jgi:hypothetical protein
MIGRALALLALGLLMAGCTMPPPSPPSSPYASQTRCLSQPQRGQNYSPDRPLVYLFCVESP